MGVVSTYCARVLRRKCPTSWMLRTSRWAKGSSMKTKPPEPLSSSLSKPTSRISDLMTCCPPEASPSFRPMLPLPSKAKCTFSPAWASTVSSFSSSGSSAATSTPASWPSSWMFLR